MAVDSIDQMLQLAFEHHRAGRLVEAEAYYRQVLAVQPAQAVALNLLATIASQVGKTAIAIKLFERVVALQPNSAAAFNNLGNALEAQSRLVEASAHYERAIAIKPDCAEAFYGLGNVLRAQNRLNEAIAAYDRAISLKPDFAEAYNNRGNALRSQNRLDEAIASYERVVALQPDNARAIHNLASALGDVGRVEEALAGYQRSCELLPDHCEARNDLIALMHFDPLTTPEQIFDQIQRWGRHDATTSAVEFASDRSPDRQLRIGYVSADFKEHSVAYFLLPLIEAHDPTQFHITCYAANAAIDGLTLRFRSAARAWRTIVDLPDAQVAKMIREDRIDILVELSGRTIGHRMEVFTSRHAPVQAQYLGCYGTSGLKTMDYWLTDAYNDPPHQTEPFCTETLVRLPNTFAVYNPLFPTPPVAPEVPSARIGRTTFGVFNNILKIHDPVVELWTRILLAVPGSQLLFQSKILADAGSRELVRQRFLRHGLPEDRIILRGSQPLNAYLRTLTEQADVCLDPFPFTGHTTTLQALWMGVPVVTLAGRTHVARRGVSVMSNLRLNELIASTSEEYVRIAVELARDIPRLTELRRLLRQRMQHSPLMDAPRFARNLEAAYRQMWRKWCEGTG